MDRFIRVEVPRREAEGFFRLLAQKRIWFVLAKIPENGETQAIDVARHPVHPIAEALVVWLKSSPHRKAKITTEEGGIIPAEELTLGELQAYLETSRQICSC